MRGKPLRATPCAACHARSTRHRGGPRNRLTTTLIHSRPSQRRLPPLAQYSVGPVAHFCIGADSGTWHHRSTGTCGGTHRGIRSCCASAVGTHRRAADLLGHTKKCRGITRRSEFSRVPRFGVDKLNDAHSAASADMHPVLDRHRNEPRPEIDPALQAQLLSIVSPTASACTMADDAKAFW